jgi:uncharacterized membrane protein
MTTEVITAEPAAPPTTPLRNAARLALAAAMIFAGLSHLFWARETFQAQVPKSIPMDPDGVVMASGGVEIMLGAGLAVLTRDRAKVGRILAAFFIAVFPGNLAQFVNKRDGFGLNSPSWWHGHCGRPLCRAGRRILSAERGMGTA